MWILAKANRLILLEWSNLNSVVPNSAIVWDVPPRVQHVMAGHIRIWSSNHRWNQGNQFNVNTVLDLGEVAIAFTSKEAKASLELTASLQRVIQKGAGHYS